LNIKDKHFEGFDKEYTIEVPLFTCQKSSLYAPVDLRVSMEWNVMGFYIILHTAWKK